jgi:hypothetical protein
VHKVSIKPIGSLNGEYNTVESNIVTVNLGTPANELFSEPFTGTVIDTTTTWDLVNTGFPDVTFSQNDSLIVTSDFNGTGQSGANNYLKTKSSAIWESSDGNMCMVLNIQTTLQNPSSNWSIKLGSDDGNQTFGVYSSNYQTAETNELRFVGKSGGVSTLDSTVMFNATTEAKTIKVFWNRTSNNVTFSYWYDGNWIEVASASNLSVGSQSMGITVTSSCYSPTQAETVIKNLKVFDDDIYNEFS